jgi:Tol biopolymer transport system component
VVGNASFPEWSPDGTQIGFMRGPDGHEDARWLEATFGIVDVDGSNVRLLGYGGTGAWNPQPRTEP